MNKGIRAFAEITIIFGASLAFATPAFATTQITVTPEVCGTLTNAVEAPGVEYQPAVAANGDAVAPADIDGTTQIKPPKQLTFYITDALASRLTGSAGALYPQAAVGAVTYDNGRVLFNGQPIDSSAQGELQTLCAGQQR